MFRKIAYAFVVIVLVAAGSGAGFVLMKRESLKQKKDFDGKLSALQKQIAGLGEQIGKIPGAPPPTVLGTQELTNRQTVHEKSQDELLTEAVAKVTPAVVSIVISKDVPQLEVVYENPFGDDPFFKDFGVQVPRYRQKGTVNQKVGAGTGFLVDSRGYIVTNRHVVADNAASYTALLSDGKQKPASIVYVDPVQDLAVVKIEGSNYPAISFGDSGTLKLGQTVIAIGNALGEYNNSVSVGIISGLNRQIEASGPGAGTNNSEQLSGVIQTDAAINPGNSGGPLVTLDGHVVGVNVATVQGSSNISFSVPANIAKDIVKRVVR